jgi:hypothetical protein
MYADPDVVKQYYDMLSRVLGAVHPSKAARDAASTLAQQVIDLETKLIDATPPLEDQREPAVSRTPCQGRVER